MKISKKIILFLVFTIITTSGFGCKLTDKKTKEATQPVVLNYWRVWDGPDAFEEIIEKYKLLHPYVTINYKKLRYSEYEDELLNALAEDKGPDIFSIHNTWIKKYENKIKPMPDSITMAYPVVKGTIKKEVVTELKTNKSITLRELKNNFVDVVAEDVVLDVYDEKTETYSQKIFGLPLSVDAMGLFYNKDLLNNAGIATPPAYWNESFQKAVKALSKQNTKGEIIQSGMAFGGSTNIERYSDVLALLMMQNGAQMIDEKGNVTFHIIPPYLKNERYNPGLQAMMFYTDFANPAKEVYCWNGEMDNSLDKFTQGSLAMMLGYSYHLPTIRAMNPKLNFGVAKVPQIEGNTPMNVANYWIETVSNKSENADIAWDFVQFATQAEQASIYLAKTNKPTALRSLIDGQLDDEDIGVFAEQVLTAKNWYRGDDSNAAEIIMGDMIEEVIRGEDKIENIMKINANRIQQTVNKKVDED